MFAIFPRRERHLNDILVDRRGCGSMKLEYNDAQEGL